MNLIGGGRLIELDTLACLRDLRDRAPAVYIASSLPMSDAALALSHAPQSLQAVQVSDSASSLCTSAGSSSTAIRSSKVFCISVAGIAVGFCGVAADALFISAKEHGPIVFVRALWIHMASIRRVPLFKSTAGIGRGRSVHISISFPKRRRERSESTTRRAPVLRISERTMRSAAK